MDSGRSRNLELAEGAQLLGFFNYLFFGFGLAEVRRRLFKRKTCFFCYDMRWKVRLWGRNGLSSWNISSEIFLIACFDFIEKMQFSTWWRYAWSENGDEPSGMCLCEYFPCYWWQRPQNTLHGDIINFSGRSIRSFPSKLVQRHCLGLSLI